MDLYGLAALKAHGEALDQLALIGKGLGGIHDALGLAPHGRNEALLRGDVGIEENALPVGLAAAAEPGFFDHAHSQVRAVGSGIVQRGNAQVVQVGAPVHQVLVMVLPGLHGIPIHTGRGKNGLPQLLHGLGATDPGEHLLGPGQAGHGSDAPLLPVLHLVGEGLENGIAVLSGLGHFRHVDALQAVRVVGDEMDAAGQGLHLMLPLLDLPVLHGGQGLEALVAHMVLGERRVVPFDGHFPCLGLIGFLYHHGNKFRLVQVGINDHILALLDVDAHPDNEAGIFPQNSLFHVLSLLHGKRYFYSSRFRAVRQWTLHFSWEYDIIRTMNFRRKTPCSPPRNYKPNSPPVP